MNSPGGSGWKVSIVANLLALLTVALLLTSCAGTARNLFVLIPDPGGSTGEITVSNKAGAQVITRPNFAAEVKDASTPPGPPQPIDEKEIKRIFGPALAAAPEPPVAFILYFERGSTNLTGESASLLPAIIGTIEARKSHDISVVGHSDRVGTREKNYELSLDRALRIKETLVSKGVDAAAIEAESHGEDNPLVKTADEVPEPKNRRVEVHIR